MLLIFTGIYSICLLAIYQFFVINDAANFCELGEPGWFTGNFGVRVYFFLATVMGIFLGLLIWIFLKYELRVVKRGFIAFLIVALALPFLSFKINKAYFKPYFIEDYYSEEKQAFYRDKASDDWHERTQIRLHELETGNIHEIVEDDFDIELYSILMERFNIPLFHEEMSYGHLYFYYSEGEDSVLRVIKATPNSMYGTYGSGAFYPPDKMPTTAELFHFGEYGLLDCDRDGYRKFDRQDYDPTINHLKLQPCRVETYEHEHYKANTIEHISTKDIEYVVLNSYGSGRCIVQAFWPSFFDFYETK